MLQIRPSNNIQNELNQKNTNTYKRLYFFTLLKSDLSSGVMPLNNRQRCHSALSAAWNVGPFVHDFVSSIPADGWNPNDLTGMVNCLFDILFVQ